MSGHCELCSQLGRYNVEATVRVTIPMAGERPTYRLCDDCAVEVGAYTESVVLVPSPVSVNGDEEQR